MLGIRVGLYPLTRTRPSSFPRSIQRGGTRYIAASIGDAFAAISVGVGATSMHGHAHAAFIGLALIAHAQ